MAEEPTIAPTNAEVPVVVVPAPEPEPEPQVEEEVDLVAEMVARGSIEREEQHDETMEALEQCLSQIANLTASIQSLNQTQSAENPMLVEMQRQLAEVRELQRSLIESMESRLSNPKEPSSSTNRESPIEGIVEPRAVDGETENQPPKPRRRFRKL